MLTQEQILNLKPGDKLVHEVYFETKKGYYIYCSFSPFPSFDRKSFTISPSCLSLPSEYGTSVPTPKYDPCRPFKKGDKVQPRSGKTVLASEYGFVSFHELAGQYEVNEDEARGTVTLIVNGHACFVSAFALELVTPVEELEPYSVKDDGGFYYIEKADVLHALCTFNKTSHPNAKAAAEAERDRLNEEWRKEQSND